jgi:hypothetical protein
LRRAGQQDRGLISADFGAQGKRFRHGDARRQNTPIGLLHVSALKVS